MNHQTNNKQDYIQLFLRIAIGASYICPGLDRFGVWGPPGGARISWGDWPHFMQYASKVLFFLPAGIAEVFAFIASLSEIIFGTLLIIGLFTRWAALGSGLLLLTFALCMTFAFGVQAPLNYSVFTASAGSFLLATMPIYKYSLDNRLNNRRTNFDTSNIFQQ
ncbi:DoxX family protein [Chitinophaga agrisoli]|uniref:DoxX family protein n=1 Tax=Chitinophaga agrisoli TaxID=2607653 RepID=A0A5B2VWJ9_9BACT|nr:DoxX family protein [Chitinophaga agrisoli]KAA2242566.1 DoxX family protein [Chitinophaga agrisoli]